MIIFKGGKSCTCDKDQWPAMQAGGWFRTSAEAAADEAAATAAADEAAALAAAPAPTPKVPAPIRKK